ASTRDPEEAPYPRLRPRERKANATANQTCNTMMKTPLVRQSNENEAEDPASRQVQYEYELVPSRYALNGTLGCGSGTSSTTTGCSTRAARCQQCAARCINAGY